MNHRESLFIFRSAHRHESYRIVIYFQTDLLSTMDHRESSFIFRYIVTCTLHCVLLSYYIYMYIDFLL